MSDIDVEKNASKYGNRMKDNLSNSEVVNIDTRREKMPQISSVCERMFTVNSYATVEGGGVIRGSSYIGGIASALAERQITKNKNKSVDSCK